MLQRINLQRTLSFVDRYSVIRFYLSLSVYFTALGLSYLVPPSLRTISSLMIHQVSCRNVFS